jgi:uncharacterized RDD family membrane protein YckC
MEAETIAYFVILAFLRTYGVKRWGGTPGKLICGLKIVKSSLEPVGWKEVWLRDVVYIFFSIIAIAFYIQSLERVPAADFEGLSRLELSRLLLSHQGIVGKIQSWAGSAWSIVDGIVLLCNSRRRAAHDFIAGTVVIRKSAPRQELSG